MTHLPNSYSLHSTHSASLSHISNDTTISYQIHTPFIHLSQLPSPISPMTHPLNSYSLYLTHSASLSHISNDTTISYQIHTPFINAGSIFPKCEIHPPPPKDLPCQTPSLLQEHPLLAWPLFIFLLILAFYLYPKDYMHIHMQYLFWLTILSPYLYWLYSLWPYSHLSVPYLLVGSPAHSPMSFPLYWYSPCYTLNPLPYYRSMMMSPLTLTTPLVSDSSLVILTIVSVCDSVPPLPLPYYQSLTQFPFGLPISVLLLTAWSVLKFLTYINPVYHSCIP
jgi:hypothetical protein